VRARLLAVGLLALLVTPWQAQGQTSRADARLRERCEQGKEKPEHCLVLNGGAGQGSGAGGSAGAGGGAGRGSGPGAGGGPSNERRTIAQRVPRDVWQWRHCGNGIGKWVGESGTINQGTGIGSVAADGTGSFEFRWTNLGGIDVEIVEHGTLRLETHVADGGTAAQTLTVAITDVTGFLKLPRPIGHRPVDPTQPPSPQGTFAVAVETLAGGCNPDKP
jgi:hypothetical protein